LYATDLEKSLQTLKDCGVLLYPTDTVWGIGCDATCVSAVERIFAIKQRCETRAMLVLVDGFDMLSGYIDGLPDIAKQLIEQSTKPLTIIYPKAINLASNLVSDDGSIGIRIVNEPFCKELIKAFGKPVVSTSANISGSATPAKFDEIEETVKNKVDYITKWRQNDLQPAAPSSIIKINMDGSYKILR